MNFALNLLNSQGQPHSLRSSVRLMTTLTFGVTLSGLRTQPSCSPDWLLSLD